MNPEQFNREVFQSLHDVRQRNRFDGLFNEVVDDFTAPVDARRRAQAIDLLRRLGVDPDSTSDTDWGRVSFGMLGEAPRRRDILAAASYGIGTDVVPPTEPLDFPEFETDHLLGLNTDKILVIADLYYIHVFDRLGIFRVIDELGRRTFDPAFDLGNSAAGLQLYTYIKRKKLRFPDEDRSRLLEQVFEGAGKSPGPFKRLLGRFVEALIEYSRVRNAGELVGTTSGTRPSVYTRSAVIRSAMNLQRYMSDAGGGILRYLRDESGAQLNDCFDILSSPDVQRYWGGDFKSGLWAVVEGVLSDLDGSYPESDRARTLAVHGRRALQFLARNTANVEQLTDADIDEVAEHVQNWIAAYRRPETEPSWLEDDEYEEEDEDLADRMADDALRDTAGEDDYESADVLD